MLRVGLTGGLGSGKSRIAKDLASLGAHVIEADVLGHQVLLPGAEAYAPVLSEFGEAILDPEGKIDRKKLSEIVFNNPERLAKLTAIVHPAVRNLARAQTKEFEREDPSGILIYEAAILVETGGYRDFDKLIVAACPVEIQIERAMKRDHSTREQAEARLSRQLPLSEKLRYADFVIDTSGPMERTLEQTRKVFEKLNELK